MNRSQKSRWLVASLIALVASLLLSSCMGGGGATGGNSGASSGGKVDKSGPGKFEADSTMAKIQKRDRLIVGITLNNYPFAYTDSNTGSIVGFDIEIANQIAKGIFGSQIEGKVEFLEIDARDREIALEGNRVDIAMGRYDITVARKKFVDFAGPYYVAEQMAIVARNNRNIASLLDLSGKKVCVLSGSTDVAALKEQSPGVDVSTEKRTIQECGVALKAQQVDAVVVDSVDARTLLTDRNFTSLKPFNRSPYGIGLHKGNTDFRKYINDRLEGPIADLWDELFDRTAGVTGANGEQPPVDRY